VVHAVLLEPLPFRDVMGDAGVAHASTGELSGDEPICALGGDFLDWQRQNMSLRDGVYSGGRLMLRVQASGGGWREQGEP